MPTVLLGGPLALLALLFPAVCGGLTLFLRRWRTILVVLSICSTVYLVHSWFYSWIFDSWWESQLQLWFLITLIASGGLVCQRRDSQCEIAAGCLPSASDVAILAMTAAVCLGGLIWGIRFRGSLLASYAWPLAAIAAGAMAGAWHAYRLLVLKSAVASARWDTPSVILLTLAIASACFTCRVGLKAAYGNAMRLRWSFVPPEEGLVLSSPIVVGDSVLVAAAHVNSTTEGVLYSLRRDDGQLLWSFSDEGRMKQVLSSPCYSNGRIYIGEGFHTNECCKLYCISAANGQKLWDFETKSHTESTPRVVDGRVFFGAGDDGLYCLNSLTGESLWHFEGPHVDNCPAYSQHRVYAGSGYGAFEVFCVDSTNGRPIWRVPVDVASFASATVTGDNVFFGLGNGTLFERGERPSGALLCLDCETGDIKWRFDLADAVHSKPAVIGQHVVIVSRDHYCYCFQTKDGQLQWKRYLGSPAVAGPVVSGVADGGAQDALYVLACDGTLFCLNTATGIPYSITAISDFGRARPRFTSTPAVTFTNSVPFGQAQVYVGGNSTRLATHPALFCFE